MFPFSLKCLFKGSDLQNTQNKGFQSNSGLFKGFLQVVSTLTVIFFNTIVDSIIIIPNRVSTNR